MSEFRWRRWPWPWPFDALLGAGVWLIFYGVVRGWAEAIWTSLAFFAVLSVIRILPPRRGWGRSR